MWQSLHHYTYCGTCCKIKHSRIRVVPHRVAFDLHTKSGYTGTASNYLLRTKNGYIGIAHEKRLHWHIGFAHEKQLHWHNVKFDFAQQKRLQKQTLHFKNG